MDTKYLLSLCLSNELKEKEKCRKGLFKILLENIYLLDFTEYYFSHVYKIAQSDRFEKLKV